VDQPSATTPEAAPPPAPDDGLPVDAVGEAGSPGFRTRGRVRRRVRFLRKARELAYRDLGGLVFNLHRFGQRNDTLVIAKLGTLAHIDAELRSLETALQEHQPVTVLREAGVTACPRCAAIHSGEDRFCPNCGLSMSRHVDLPIAGGGPAPSDGAPGGAAPPSPSTPAPPPAPAPASTAAAGPAAGPSAPDAQAGRSPTGPPVAAPAAPPPALQTPPSGEDPTEIIHPPTAGT
jgi:hypothetical protein